MKDQTDWIANVIKIAAVLTAAPRWVGALLGAEGFILPAAWLPWWVPVSAALSACMALVEGAAFAYVFEAWRNQQDKDGNKLLWFALVSAGIFVGVLAPYIAASVRHTGLTEILTNGWTLGLWAAAVGASTISIVASVGYAQKRKAQKVANPELDAAKSENKELRQQVKDLRVIEQKAGERVTEMEKERTVLQEKLAGLLQPDKRERILSIHHFWPEMQAKDIVTLSGASPSYVSEVLNSNGRTHEPAHEGG